MSAIEGGFFHCRSNFGVTKLESHVASNFSPLTNSLSFVAAACSEAQVSYTSTENDDIHLQVSLSWHGIHWITDASSKLLGYIY